MILNNHTDQIPHNAVYIGRGSFWGNPFRIGPDGDRDQVCDRYDERIRRMIESGEIPLHKIAALHGRPLVCFCAPARCHGETLVRESRKAHILLQVERLVVGQGELDPEGDGVTHINVYSKGRTRLGIMLSNFAKTPFRHPEFGRFDSMEGFYYWVSTGRIHDDLRRLSGYSAKDAGRRHQRVEVPGFEKIMLSGLREKIKQNPGIRNALAQSDLPLAHYYVYGKKVVPAGAGWLVAGLEGIRAAEKLLRGA